jgi:DNA/RNA endonuclease YhcR with UshA esterase domain
MFTGGFIMRQLASLLIFVLSPALVTADGPNKPITPAEAAKKVNEKVTVEFQVKSVGGNTNGYLNSETDYKDAKNFTVFLPKETIDKYKEMKINDPRAHFKDKTIQVSGTVTLYQEKPQIKVEAPDQIKIVEKK